MRPSDLVSAQLQSQVEALVREVAVDVIMPRFRQLRTSEVHEKSPGEVVTIADRESETMLGEGLSAILPNARVVGEEACETEPSLLNGLDKGLIWIVDPLDGTANFAAGREPFGIIIALVLDGVVIAGWLYNPVSNLLSQAVLGQGAYVSYLGEAPRRLRVAPYTGRPVAALATQFMSPDLRKVVADSAAHAFDVMPIPRCAAEHYAMLCRGQHQVAMFQRTLPWDHAAGALLLTEAGGQVSRWDGTPYRFHDDALGIIAASSPDLWRTAIATIIDGNGQLAEARTLTPQPSL